jgi:hypothetical protein
LTFSPEENLGKSNKFGDRANAVAGMIRVAIRAIKAMIIVAFDILFFNWFNCLLLFIFDLAKRRISLQIRQLLQYHNDNHLSHRFHHLPPGWFRAYSKYPT